MTDTLDAELKERLRREDIAHHFRQIEKLKEQRNAINRKIAAEEKTLRELQGVK